MIINELIKRKTRETRENLDPGGIEIIEIMEVL